MSVPTSITPPTNAAALNIISPLALAGKRGLIVGVANDRSIAWGCARAMRAAGAEIAMTYMNEKTRPYTQLLADAVGAPLFLELDVQSQDQLESVFAQIQEKWGKLDFLVHSIAFAPKDDLHGRVVDTSAEGFSQAMDISCHSLIRMAKLAEPLMQGGTILTMSYLGADEVIPSYGIMGPVKAALEASTRYLAAELGEKDIRVIALSPGPLHTRAASGIKNFDALAEKAESTSPLHRLVNIDEIGAMAAFLASDAARSLTGDIIYLDAGYHVMG